MKTHRQIVVVLGSGRSGTSLLMQALGALGVRLSDAMIEARQDNPDGFFEDREIVHLHVALLKALGAWPFFQPPADWQARPETVATAAALQDVLHRRLQGGGVWGFKDPRASTFYPLWQRLFAANGVEAKPILALRDPAQVIRSFVRAYATSPETAEAVWLARTCDALRHTQGHVHIVHYEDWFSRPQGVAAGLAAGLGLALPEEGEALPGIVKPDLNRAAAAPHPLQSLAARRLAAALQDCRGDDFDREGLLRVVAGIES